jgi:hypothetical protein
MDVLAAWFDVDDSGSPVGGLNGGAIDAQRWSGAMRFGLNAVDSGAGLSLALIQVDGLDAAAIPLGTDSCQDVGPDPALREYVVAQPCPARIDDGTLEIDTSKLPQGSHTVRVLLEDAAGNRSTIFGPVTRTIAANGAVGPGSEARLRGEANGVGASDEARLTAHWGRRSQRTSLVSAFGHAHVVRGG